MQAVYQPLKKQFLIYRPCGVFCQTGFLKRLEGSTELAACLRDIAQLLLFVQISGLERIDKLGYGFVTAVISQIIHFDLQAVQQTYGIVDGVGLVVKSCVLCFVTVAAGNHRQYGKHQNTNFFHKF